MNEYLQNGQQFGWGPKVAKLNPDKAKLLKSYAIGKVIDIACGSGIYTKYLEDLGHEVVGVDNEPEFVREAKNAYPKIKFVNAGAEKLPFEKNSFDTAVLFDILEHVDDGKVLSEALRVARRVVISVPHQNQEVLNSYGLSHAHYLDRTHLRVYTRDTLEKLFQSKKLNIIYLEPSLPLSISGLLIHQLSQGKPIKSLLLKAVLKPFLPEPPIFSTLFAVVERS